MSSLSVVRKKNVDPGYADVVPALLHAIDSENPISGIRMPLASSTLAPTLILYGCSSEELEEEKVGNGAAEHDRPNVVRV